MIPLLHRRGYDNELERCINSRLTWVLAVLLSIGALGCGALRSHPAAPPAATTAGRRIPPPQMNRAFLAAEPYTRLRVEIDYIADDPPSDHAVKALESWLRGHVAKPGGIEVVVDDAIDKESFGKSRAELVQVARDHADGPPDEGTYYVYVLYAPKYQSYRGVAWSAGGLSSELPYPVVFMLTRTLRRDSILWLTRKKVEAAVIIHEFGHVAGLVSANDHNDGTRHCTDPACRMYRRVDLKSIATTFVPVVCFGVLPTEFCTQCQRDLAYGRGEARWYGEP